ncbi:MAG TPA: NAD-dependent epimerase/dehydratase family protein [Actinomycetospora sp.]|jgi:UDP-glucose 4-epimerase|nr:NAD-dependent epimerase/dehydratase family protein [Actinomycetospora sp.]
MSEAPSVVLVTGVSRFLGGHLAARLASDPSIERVLGVDTTPPSREMRRRMGRAEFVRVDIRNPLIGKVISTAKVDTVVHASLSGNPGQSGGRSMMMEMNVIGTMQLLAACQRSDTVRRLVVKSTSAVYGASSRDPATFTEQTEPKAIPPGGYAKDAVEIEGYVRSFSRRRPDIPVTTLRFVNLIGPRIDTSFVRYFSLPVVPVVLGYDARVQLLHEEDAVAVLERAAANVLPGVYNVGGAGVLMLSQAIRRAGRIPLPIPQPAVPLVGRFTRRARLVDFSPEQMRLLNFGRVVDTTKLRGEFGFTPRWTTVQAFDDFVAGRGLRPVIDPARLGRLQDTAQAVARALPSGA